MEERSDTEHRDYVQDRFDRGLSVTLDEYNRWAKITGRPGIQPDSWSDDWEIDRPLTREEVAKLEQHAAQWGKRVAPAGPLWSHAMEVQSVVAAWRELHKPGILQPVAIATIRVMAPDLAAALDRLAENSNGH